MAFKNLLLGLGGSVAVGGVGYGIYSSSQSSKKESMLDSENSISPGSPEGESGSTSLSGDQGEGFVQPQGEGTDKDGSKDTGTEGGRQSAVSPQTGAS